LLHPKHLGRYELQWLQLGPCRLILLRVLILQVLYLRPEIGSLLLLLLCITTDLLGRPRLPRRGRDTCRHCTAA
jgi:hypothetical protein